jgi:hypothetical protein
MHLPADISGLINCEVDLQPDGSTTADTLLQRWPSCAPAPQRLIIVHLPPADNRHPLLAFFSNCAQQEPAMRLLRDVKELRVHVSSVHRCHPAHLGSTLLAAAGCRGTAGTSSLRKRQSKQQPCCVRCALASGGWTFGT